MVKLNVSSVSESLFGIKVGRRESAISLICLSLSVCYVLYVYKDTGYFSFGAEFTIFTDNAATILKMFENEINN